MTCECDVDFDHNDYCTLCGRGKEDDHGSDARVHGTSCSGTNCGLCDACRKAKQGAKEAGRVRRLHLQAPTEAAPSQGSNNNQPEDNWDPTEEALQSLAPGAQVHPSVIDSPEFQLASATAMVKRMRAAGKSDIYAMVMIGHGEGLPIIMRNGMPVPDLAACKVRLDLEVHMVTLEVYTEDEDGDGC